MEEIVTYYWLNGHRVDDSEYTFLKDDAEVRGFATYQEIRKILLSGILSVR
jgi:hypothetical protein